MKTNPPSSAQKIPKKYQPKNFEIIYEDLDLIVGIKAAGALVVGAKWNRDDTIHEAVNRYFRKGNLHSKKSVFVVHRLDQATTGLLVFAKSEKAQSFMKDNWAANIKIYYTIVHGKFEQKSGTISSYLQEDEGYVVKSTTVPNEGERAKLAHTEYTVLKENEKFSLLRINLRTGRKNQIRVHMQEAGHPVVGDNKYGRKGDKFPNLALHSAILELTHPFNKERIRFEAPVPMHFHKLVDFSYT